MSELRMPCCRLSTQIIMYNVCCLSNLTDNLHIYGMLIPSSCIYLYMKALGSGTSSFKVGNASSSEKLKEAGDLRQRKNA